MGLLVAYLDRDPQDWRDHARLDLRSAAIHEQFDTRDETGVIRRQKQRYLTLANSSGSPMRPIGTVDTIRAITSADCRLASGVLIGPGLTTFERIRRSFRSVGQGRTNERMAALLAA